MLPTSLRLTSKYYLAGVPGFEPGLSVLETDVLTVDTIPLRKRGVGYRVTGASQIDAYAKLTPGTCNLAPFTSFLYDQCVGGNGDRTC